MKRSLIAALLGLCLISVSCYNDDIQELNNRIDNIENDKIATVQKQVASISTSILDMQRVDAQLTEYIATLEKTAESLQKSLKQIDAEIDDVEKHLKDEVKYSESLVLQELESYKGVVKDQLDAINAAIEQLKGERSVLEEEIYRVRKYVDQEIMILKDWTSVTYATLEQFELLAENVAAIQETVNALNRSMEDVESLISKKVANELGNATAGLRESLQEDMKEIAMECNDAIAAASTQITRACESMIKSVIAELESSIKSWVNEQLSGYYTASQIDSKLQSMEYSFESQLKSQEKYLQGLITSLEETMASKIMINDAAIAQLEDGLSSLSSEVSTIAAKVTANSREISNNAGQINYNSKQISNNAGAIEANAQLIAANEALIDENNELIRKNESEIRTLKNRLGTAESDISKHASLISQNASDIASNASLISKNAAAISNNGAAIAANSQAIYELEEQLYKTKEEITAAYKSAISTAITNLEGKLSGKIAAEVQLINSRIDDEVKAINAAIATLADRVTQCEKDIKSIKTSIYNMQIEISDIQDQIEAILARIQSIEYIPQYSDGKATMYYTNNGKITPGSATFDFELQPAATAEELADVWEEALSMKAVHTQTRAAINFVDMEIVSVTAEDGVLTVVVSGADLSDDFYLGRISANACLVISDGNNELASDYINMVPWTTDVIYVPDAAFKAYLVENFDADSDGEISEDEAMDIEAIDLSDVATKVTTLAGIEYMKNLKTIIAAYHSLTGLDLSHNNALTEVVVNNNKLKTLDLSGCSAIVSLECSGNKLTTLDVSEASGLTDLACSNNEIGSLDLTNNKSLVNLQCSGNNIATLNLKNLLALETLYCMSNDLAVLDLSKNTALKELDCSSNNLTTLNLNKNVALEMVYCRSNSLSSLYLNECIKMTMLDCSKNALTTLNLNGCKAIETLNCSDNSIVTLDLTALKALETFDCSGNDLVSLDVSANSALASVDCSDNASLAKLWVKDAAHQEQMMIKKDNVTNVFFNAGGLVFPDKALETYMLANYDDDYDGVISIAEADNVTTVNCANKGISDLTGLESCTNLVYLNCSNNNIKVVDCHTLAKLESLSCYGNPVEVLDLTNCAVLQSLFLQNVSTNAVSGTTISVNGYDQAASLKFSVANTPFKTLSIVNSSVLTDLNVLSNDNLEIFNGYGNTALTNLFLSPYFKEVHAYGCSVLEGTDVSAISGLAVLDLHSCALTSLDVDSNPELVTLDCSSNQLTKLNVDNNTGLVTLKVNGNNLTQFKVANNTALETLWVSDNQLSAINVRSNTALKDLRLSNNIDITALNLKSNTALETLYADGLSISEINLVENSGLKRLSLLDNNNLTSLYSWPNFSDITTSITLDHVVVMTKSDTTVEDFPVIGTRLVDSQRISGVVFKCGGSFCYIMSVREGSSLSWSTEKATTGATNSYDGKVNMNTIKARNSDLSKYPAFKWCADYGSDWCLPALNDLKTIYNNRSNLNTALSNAGGTTLSAGYYWSSTEYSGTGAYSGSSAYSVYFSNGDSSYYSKSSTDRVRAVRAL